MSDVWYKSPLFLNFLKLLNDGYQLKWATVFVGALFFCMRLISIASV